MSNNKKVLALVIILPFILFLANLKIISLNADFMQSRFDKYNVYDNVPEADVIFDEIVDYFSGGNELNVSQFNEREIDHMKDVKKLVVAGNWIFFILLGMFFLLFSNICINFSDLTDFRNRIGKILLIGASFGLVFFASLALLITNSFRFIFVGFHKLFFKNGTWTFNPKTEIIVRVFPEPVFFDIPAYTLGILFIELLAVFLIGFLIYTDKKKVKEIFMFFRPFHSILSMLGLLLGAFVVGSFSTNVLAAMFAIGFFCSANFMMNDLLNIKVDRVNKPHRIFPSEIISKKIGVVLIGCLLVLSFLLGISVSIEFFFILIILFLFSFYYSRNAKKYFSAFIAAGLFASTILIGGFLVGKISFVLFYYFLFAFIFVFCRELIKDIEDVRGDKKYKFRTIPIILGKKKTLKLVRSIAIASFFILLFAFGFKLLNGIFLSILTISHLLLYYSYRVKNTKTLIYFGLIIGMITAFVYSTYG